MKRRLINAVIMTAKWLWLPQVSRIGAAACVFAVLHVAVGGPDAMPLALLIIVANSLMTRILRPTVEALVPIGEWSGHFPTFNANLPALWLTKYDPETGTWSDPVMVRETDKGADQ